MNEIKTPVLRHLSRKILGNLNEMIGWKVYVHVYPNVHDKQNKRLTNKNQFHSSATGQKLHLFKRTRLSTG